MKYADAPRRAAARGLELREEIARSRGLRWRCVCVRCEREYDLGLIELRRSSAHCPCWRSAAARRVSPAVRAVQVLTLLHDAAPGGFWVDDACRQLDANRAQVRRALETIERAGVRLERVRRGAQHVALAALETKARAA